jgi:hypothetical protein
MQLSPPSIHLPLLTSKYSPQHPVCFAVWKLRDIPKRRLKLKTLSQSEIQYLSLYKIGCRLHSCSSVNPPDNCTIIRTLKRSHSDAEYPYTLKSQHPMSLCQHRDVQAALPLAVAHFHPLEYNMNGNRSKIENLIHETNTRTFSTLQNLPYGSIFLNLRRQDYILKMFPWETQHSALL